MREENRRVFGVCIDRVESGFEFEHNALRSQISSLETFTTRSSCPPTKRSNGTAHRAPVHTFVPSLHHLESYVRTRSVLHRINFPLALYERTYGWSDVGRRDGKGWAWCVGIVYTRMYKRSLKSGTCSDSSCAYQEKPESKGVKT